LLVIWGGPALGSLIPLGILQLARTFGYKIFYLWQFFAGFCLIANGAYLGVGSFFGVGDAGDLARVGCPRWVMAVFGSACLPMGLYLWNGLGQYFGLNEPTGKVDRKAACGTLTFTLVVLIVETLANCR
jgi:hypothetical protein